MEFANLVLPNKVILDSKTATNSYGKFIAEPYESGYGHTVGNSLRRIALSSLEGSAITAVKIKGAIHEYSTLPNVKEDVINIILNLKKLRLKLTGKEKDYVLLSVKKQGVVTGKDIKETANVKIINKDLVLANLESGGSLEIEIEVSRGKGYVAEEEIAKIQRPEGFIPMDAVFSPIVKIQYDVEPARVGQKTDYDRLVLEITTDGSVEPKVALSESAKLLQESLEIFTIPADEADETEEVLPVPVEKKEATDKDNDDLDQSIEFIELSSRSVNCLKSEGIHTVRDLISKTEAELKIIKNFGSKCLVEIDERLKEMGLDLVKESKKKK